MKYKHVYFRIESGYQWGSGMAEDKSEKFYTEIKNLFLANGWSIKPEQYSYGKACTVVKGKESLYIHPQSLSGVVSLDNIQEIETLLSKGITFKHYHTDTYEDVFDMSDEEYTQYFKTIRDEIAQKILTTLKTKRSNLYITSDICFNIAQKYSLKRINNPLTGFSSGRIEIQFVSDIFNELLEQKKIVSAKTRNGTGYRTATKKDFKKAV